MAETKEGTSWIEAREICWGRFLRQGKAIWGMYIIRVCIYVLYYIYYNIYIYIILYIILYIIYIYILYYI